MPLGSKLAHSLGRYGAGRLALAAAAIGLAALMSAVVLPPALAGATPDAQHTVAIVDRLRIAIAGGAPSEDHRVIRQRTAFDCGPTSLANLLLLEHRQFPSNDSLATLARTTTRGTTLGALTEAARALGLASHADRVPLDRRLETRTPFIAWIDHGHFVVVESLDHRIALLIDPAVGRYSLSATRLLRRWTGEALLPDPL